MTLTRPESKYYLCYQTWSHLQRYMLHVLLPCLLLSNFLNIIREKAEITKLFLDPNSFIPLEILEMVSKYRGYLDKDK